LTHVNAAPPPQARYGGPWYAERSEDAMRYALPALVLGCLVATVPAWAGDPNEAKGIIVSYCIKCHTVPGYNPIEGLPTVEAPDLGEIANHPETYPLTRMRAWLRDPHYPMGQFILSATDIENLTAFIESLRGK